MARKIYVNAEEMRLIADLKAKRNALADATKAEKAASALVKHLLPEAGDEAIIVSPEGDEIAVAERKFVSKQTLDAKIVADRAPATYRRAMKDASYLTISIAK